MYKMINTQQIFTKFETVM